MNGTKKFLIFVQINFQLKLNGKGNTPTNKDGNILDLILFNYLVLDRIISNLV